MIQFLATTQAGCRRLFPRHLLHRIATLVFIAVVGLSTQTLSFAESKANSATRPNIVLILADDLGYGDLGCYGQKLIETPNLDRLAAQGIRFTQAYAGGPVCTASRSVLMTGLHNGHAPARDNVPHYPTYLVDEDVTVAEVLKGAGYRCGGVGKWSLGDAGTQGSALNQGFDSWYGYLNQDHAHYYWTEYLDDNRGRHELPGNPVSQKHYSHDLMTERALDFIRESKDAPFFFYAAFTLPHFSSPQEDPDGMAVPSTDPYTDRPWNDKAKKYAAMVHRLDESVGQIVGLIDELGLAEQTLILFSSDNGGHATVWKEFDTNGPLRGYKRDLTEGGIRVPLIGRWTGNIPAGAVSDQVVAFQDFLPTFSELAAAPPPPDVDLDGIPVTPALLGKPLDVEREYLYWDYGHCRRYYDSAVRFGDWKALRLGADNGRIQLYNLKQDLGESNDVANEHPEILSRVAEIMKVAVDPSPFYRVGQLYRGQPIWRAENQHASQVKLPPVTEVGIDGMLAAEFIFPPDARPTPTCHSSTLVELPSGDLAAAWFGGTSEPDVDNVIWYARRQDGRWTKPQRVVDGGEGETRDHRVGNPVLFQPAGQPLMLFYKVVDPDIGRASSWWGMLTTSSDDGKTWSTPRRLGSDAKLGAANSNLIGPVKNKPIRLADGGILCPSSSEHDRWRVHFERTRDFGKTWEVIGPINDASRFNVIQPSVLVHSDGRLQVLCRSKEGVIAQAWSDDGGETWGPVTTTNLPNPNAGTDAVTLADGRHLVVYNHTVRGGPFPNARSMLNVAVSADGQDWRPVLTLERQPGEYSYPAIIQTRDGSIHISYTWKRETIKHVTIDPNQIR